MSNLTFVFTTGPNELEVMSDRLLDSIQRNTSATSSDIMIYVVKSEKESISDSLLKKISNQATLIEGPMPNPDYPNSAAQGALKKASELSDNDYILLLDTDTVVLDDINIHTRKDKELFLCPEFISTRYWSNLEKSYETWVQLYDEYGFNFPKNLIKTTVDDEYTVPFYNSGMILTANNDLPERLLNLSSELHGELPEANYYAEMVALSLLSTDYDLCVVDEKYNYPQVVRVEKPPTSTKIIHYFNEYSLYRSMLDQNVRSSLEGTKSHNEFRSATTSAILRKCIADIYLVFARRTSPDMPPYRNLRELGISVLDILNMKSYIKKFHNKFLSN